MSTSTGPPNPGPLKPLSTTVEQTPFEIPGPSPHPSTRNEIKIDVKLSAHRAGLPGARSGEQDASKGNFIRMVLLAGTFRPSSVMNGGTF